MILTTQTWLGQDYPAPLEHLLPDLPDLRSVVVKDAQGGDGRLFFSLGEVVARGDTQRRGGARLLPGQDRGL